MGGVSQPGEVTFSASGPWWVTCGLDSHWNDFGCCLSCPRCNIFKLFHTSEEGNKRFSDCQMRRKALKLTLCLITSLSFTHTHTLFFLSSTSLCRNGKMECMPEEKGNLLEVPPPFSFCSRSFQQQSAVSGCVPLAEIKSLMPVVACFPWLAAAVDVQGIDFRVYVCVHAL